MDSDPSGSAAPGSQLVVATSSRAVVPAQGKGRKGAKGVAPSRTRGAYESALTDKEKGRKSSNNTSNILKGRIMGFAAIHNPRPGAQRDPANTATVIGYGHMARGKLRAYMQGPGIKQVHRLAAMYSLALITFAASGDDNALKQMDPSWRDPESDDEADWTDYRHACAP